MMHTHVGFRASNPMTPEEIRQSKSINQLRSRYTYIRLHPQPMTAAPPGGLSISLDIPELAEMQRIHERMNKLLRKYHRGGLAETESDSD